MLGRHVAELAFENSGLGLGCLAGRLGDAEVDELDLALVSNQHVLWRDVAVDEIERPPLGVALVVRVVQPLANLHDHEAHLSLGHGLGVPVQVVEDAPQVAPVDILEGDEVRVVHLTEIEDLGDVRVLQLHRDLRLVDEHRDELFVLGDVGEDALERNDSLEALHAHDLCLEHLGHAPDVDTFEEVVLSERSGLVQASTPRRKQRLARVIPLSTTVRPESSKPSDEESRPPQGSTLPPKPRVSRSAPSRRERLTPRSKPCSCDHQP